MRITCIIHSLDGGGAEYLMAGLASRLADHHAVTLITLDVPERDRYGVDQRVERIGLGLMRESRFLLAAIWNNVQRIRGLRRAIRKAQPDVILSFCDKTNVLVLAAVHGVSGAVLRKHVGEKIPEIPVVIAEHSDPRQQPLGTIWERLRERLYPHASGVVALSVCTAKVLGKWVRVSPKVIPPAVAPAVPVPTWDDLQTRDTADGFCWVTVGRLAPEKGFDQAIRAFAKLKMLRNNQLAHAPRDGSGTVGKGERLLLAGEGRCRAELEQLAVELGIEDSVEFLGWVDDVPALLRRANGFLLSSRYEGFPVGLLQAMAHGVPAIAFDCESGPREIIRSGVNGWLVTNQDVDSMVEAMQWVMDHRAEATAIGFSGIQVASTYNWQRYVRSHVELLEEVSERSVAQAVSAQIR